MIFVITSAKVSSGKWLAARQLNMTRVRNWNARHGIQIRLSGELRDLAKPAAFQSLCEAAAKLEWVVHVKPPFGGPRRVLKYLARYTHRVIAAVNLPEHPSHVPG